MTPEVSFQNTISKHLDRVQEREAAERQNQNWTVELFRLASLHSIKTTHFRDALIELQKVSQEVEVVVDEIQLLMPFFTWIWDIVKLRPDLMEHLSAIEDKVRDRYRHHKRHGHFFELYERNQKAGLDLFRRAMQDLVAIFKQDDGWYQDPLLALRRIHDAQDGVVLTGLFLELISETITGLKVLDADEQHRLNMAIQHLGTLGQKLHIKEDRLRHALKSAELSGNSSNDRSNKSGK